MCGAHSFANFRGQLKKFCILLQKVIEILWLAIELAKNLQDCHG